MATMEEHLNNIRSAQNGNLARTAIKNALIFANNNVGNADTLDGHPSSYFAKVPDLYNGFYKV